MSNGHTCDVITIWSFYFIHHTISCLVYVSCNIVVIVLLQSNLIYMQYYYRLQLLWTFFKCNRLQLRLLENSVIEVTITPRLLHWILLVYKTSMPWCVVYLFFTFCPDLFSPTVRLPFRPYLASADHLTEAVMSDSRDSELSVYGSASGNCDNNWMSYMDESTEFRKGRKSILFLRIE